MWEKNMRAVVRRMKRCTFPRITFMGYDLTSIAMQALSKIKHRKSDTDDLVQVAYIAMSSALTKGKVREDDNPNGYLYVIARNAIMKYIERTIYKHDTRMEHIEDVPELIDNKHHLTEEEIDVRNLIERLPDNYKRVIQMKLDGFSVPEIAEAESISSTAIRERIRRASIIIMQVINGEQDDIYTEAHEDTKHKGDVL